MFTIESISKAIQNKFSSFIQKGVTMTPHFVPLNLKVLERVKLHSGNKVFDPRKFRDSLYNYLRSNYKNTIVLKNKEFIVNGKNNVLLTDLMSKFTPALVFTNTNSKENLVGVLFNSYQSAGAALLNESITKKILAELNENVGPESGIDLAYVLRSEESAETKRFFGIFNSISNSSIFVKNTNIPDNKSELKQSEALVEGLFKDYAVHEERALGEYSIAIDKQVTNFVVNIKANIIVFHDSKLKPEVTKTLKSKELSASIASMLPNLKVFKSTFLQDIKDRIRSVFLGTKAKNVKETKKTSNKVSTSRSNVQVRSTKGINSEFIIPPAFISLTNIQNILNDRLAEYVKQNMGDGESKTILNYRTGRLAESFKVTGVSQTRDGAITAFFTYMKYPYATFSKGGAQEEPRSRDPIRLGEFAIRDIAIEILKTRLRSVGI